MHQSVCACLSYKSASLIMAGEKGFIPLTLAFYTNSESNSLGGRGIGRVQFAARPPRLKTGGSCEMSTLLILLKKPLASPPSTA